MKIRHSRNRVNCFEIRRRLRVENGKRSTDRSGVNYGETTICNWSESHCSQWGHSFAHCALRLIYFRLYSIADRSKSPARGLPLTDVNSTVHCTTDRSVQSRRSSLFDVNLRWSTVVRSSLVSFANILHSLSLSLATCTMKVNLATIRNSLTRGFIKCSNYKNYISLMSEIAIFVSSFMANFEMDS